MNRLAIYGAGGMGRETACVVSRINKKAPDTWHLVGFFDDGIPAGTATAFGPVTDVHTGPVERGDALYAVEPAPAEEEAATS